MLHDYRKLCVTDVWIYVRMYGSVQVKVRMRASTTTNSDATASGREPAVTGNLSKHSDITQGCRFKPPSAETFGTKWQMSPPTQFWCLLLPFNHPSPLNPLLHTAQMKLLRRCGGYCYCRSPDSVVFLSNCTQARHCGWHSVSCTARCVRLVEASGLLSASSWHVPCCITLRGLRKVHQRSTTLRSSARSLGTDIFRYILYFSVYQCTLCDGQ